MKGLKKSIAVLLSMAVCSAVVFTAGIGCAKDNNKTDVPSQTEIPSFDDAGIAIAFNGAPTAVYANDTETLVYVEQKITATVSPSDAAVTWSLAWKSGAALADKNINDYLYVTATTADGHSAAVRAYKSFRGSEAVLTCSAVANPDVKATVAVKFDGKPSSLTTDFSSLTTINRGTVTAYQIPAGTSVTKALKLSNIFNDVSSSYNQYSVTVTGVGSYVTGTYCNNRYGTYWEESSFKDVTLESTKADCITASISGGNVVINAKKSYKSISGSMSGNTGGVAYMGRYKQEKTTNGNLPYYTIKIVEAKSGLSVSVNVVIVPAVKSISAGSTEIVF